MLIALDKRMSVEHTPCMMKRTTVWLSKLVKLSKRTGIKMSELIRRFIDDGLKKEGR